METQQVETKTNESGSATMEWQDAFKPQETVQTQQAAEKPKDVLTNMFEESKGANSENGNEKPQASAEAATATNEEAANKGGENAGENKDAEKPQASAEAAATGVKEPVVDSFKLPDDKQLEKDLTYQDLGKILGIEVKENSVSELQNAINSYVETQKKEAAEANFLSALEKQPAEAQMAFLLQKNGTDVNQYSQNLNYINGLKKLDSVELIKHDILSSGQSEEFAEKKVAEMLENGTLEPAANEVRQVMAQAEQENTSKINLVYQNLLEKEKAHEQAQREAEISAIAKELKAINEIPGTGVKLSENAKNDIERYLRLGKFDETMNSPKAKLNAVFMEHFVKQAIEERETTLRSKLEFEAAKKKHNIPDEGSVGSVAKPKAVTDYRDAFK